MKILAADRACGKARASDQHVRDGWWFSPQPFRERRRHRVGLFVYLNMSCEVAVMWPCCITKLYTLVFLPYTIKQKLLLMSIFTSERQSTAAWWGTADGWDVLYSPCSHIDLNSALAGRMVEAHHRAASKKQRPREWVHLRSKIRDRPECISAGCCTGEINSSWGKLRHDAAKCKTHSVI